MSSEGAGPDRWFFTADEHYNHAKIVEHCGRPFQDVGEMNRELVKRFNSVVPKYGITVHVGDFGFFRNAAGFQAIVEQLNGQHIFVRGDHDLKRLGASTLKYLWTKRINSDIYIVACHWPMRVWPRKHYGALHVYGHVHGSIKDPLPRSWDVGVDSNDFCPVSLGQLLELTGFRQEMEENSGH